MKRERSDDAARIPPDPLPSILLSISSYDDDLFEARLRTYGFAYLLARACCTCPGVPDADLQEIAQEAWIAYSRKAADDTIEHPEAYIARIILNKFRDYLRWKERCSRVTMVSLSAYESGPDMDIPAIYGESLVNPANELDESLSLADFCNDLARALPALPPRQRRAMICTMLDGALDPQPLRKLLKDNHIEAAEMSWPENKDEKRLLQASLTAARHNLATLLHIDLSQYKQRRRRSEPPGSQRNQP